MPRGGSRLPPPGNGRSAAPENARSWRQTPGARDLAGPFARVGSPARSLGSGEERMTERSRSRLRPVSRGVLAGAAPRALARVALPLIALPLVLGSGLLLAGCGRAAAPPAGPEAWVTVLAGNQCELTGDRRAAVLEAQGERVAAGGIRPLSLNVASSLGGLPPGCRPAGGVQGLAARAARQDADEMTQLLSTMACAACGCPEPWFLCLRTEGADPADLASLGFLRVE